MVGLVDLSASVRSIADRPGGAWLLRALRWAPWVVFGPITGFLMERAVACFRRSNWFLGWSYVALNVGILLAIPLATASLAARL